MPSYEGIYDTDVEDLRKFLEQEVIFALHVILLLIQFTKFWELKRRCILEASPYMEKNGHKFNKT